MRGLGERSFAIIGPESIKHRARTGHHTYRSAFKTALQER